MISLQGCFFGVWEKPTCIQLYNGKPFPIRIEEEFPGGWKDSFVLCEGQAAGFRGCDSMKAISIDDGTWLRNYSITSIDSGLKANKTKFLFVGNDGLGFIKPKQVKNMWKSSGKYGCTM